MLRCGTLVVLCSLAITASAFGDYTITPKVSGSTSVTKNQGESFHLELVLSSDANDTLTSAIFTLQFTKPGLTYDSYVWDPNNFDTGSGDDYSEPRDGNLPTTLDTNTWVDTFQDPNAVDVYFDNFVNHAGSFGTGTLVALDLSIPGNFSPGKTTITTTATRAASSSTARAGRWPTTSATTATSPARTTTWSSPRPRRTRPSCT